MKAALHRCALALLLALLIVLAPGLIAPAHAADAIGLHLASVHSRPGFESATVGVYVRRDDGLTLGVLRNSYGRISTYGAWTLQTDDQRFGLTIGAITGYPAAPVMLLVAPSVRWQLAPGYGARLVLLPKPPRHGSAAALHLAIERSF